MVNMESIVNITVVQPVNHHTTVADPQGSVWTDVSLDGKDYIVIRVRKLYYSLTLIKNEQLC